MVCRVFHAFKSILILGLLLSSFSLFAAETNSDCDCLDELGNNLSQNVQDLLAVNKKLHEKLLKQKRKEDQDKVFELVRSNANLDALVNRSSPEYSNCELFKLHCKIEGEKIRDLWKQEILDKGYSGEKNSYCIKNENGCLYSNNLNLPIRPGSVSKVYVALWALETLSPNHRFKTKFYLKNKKLHIAGTNPGFFTENAFDIINQLNKDNIDSLDTISIDNDFKINSHEGGIWLRKEVKKIFNTAKWDKATQSKFDRLNGKQRSAQKRPLGPLEMKVNEVKHTETDLLKLAGSEVYEYSSKPLIHQMKRALNMSDSSYFDRLFDYLGGSKVFSQFIKDKFGDDFDKVYFHTGSGNGENYTTCNLTLRMLEEFKKFGKQYNLPLKDILPVAGVDHGTLKKRFKDSANQFYGKTGTVSNFVNLAGIVPGTKDDTFFGIFLMAKKDKREQARNVQGIFLLKATTPQMNIGHTDKLWNPLDSTQISNYDLFVLSQGDKPETIRDQLKAKVKQIIDEFSSKKFFGVDDQTYSKAVKKSRSAGFKNSHTPFKDRLSEQEKINGLDDLAKIIEFHRKKKGNYAVLDKGKETLTIYSKEGQVLQRIQLKLKYKGDKQTRKLSIFQKDGHDHDFGAGVYTLKKEAETHKLTHKGDPAIFLRDQKGGEEIFFTAASSFESAGSTFESSDYQNGKLDISKDDFKIIQSLLDQGTPVYILPYDKNNTFMVKNDTINFTTRVKRKSYYDYNYSPKSTKAIPITTIINDPSKRTPASMKFVATLDHEKEALMKLYGLSNDEYNHLARLAFGILGNESKFGKSIKLYIKEDNQLLVALAKKKLSTRNNSRGLTQIKRVPKKISDHYGVSKETLMHPSHAAVATLGFLANALSELKAKEKFHPDINSSNRFNYLHYIYMGRSSEIVKGTGTPEKNIYFRNARKHYQGITIFQKD